jgi:hypothetical protein
LVRRSGARFRGALPHAPLCRLPVHPSFESSSYRYAALLIPR